jgi:hypothetical protein
MFALEIASEYQKLLERQGNEQVDLESKLKEINELLPPLF